MARREFRLAAFSSRGAAGLLLNAELPADGTKHQRRRTIRTRAELIVLRKSLLRLHNNFTGLSRLIEANWVQKGTRHLRMIRMRLCYPSLFRHTSLIDV